MLPCATTLHPLLNCPERRAGSQESLMLGFTSKGSLVLAALLGFLSLAHAETVQLGKVEFLVDTNVKMFKFRGEAKELQSKIERKGLQLKSLELKFPVSALKTGMDLRDQHMRERIFARKDGSTPDVVFSAKSAECKTGASCELKGDLTIRGETRPQTLTLNIKDGKIAQGNAIVALSKFGIEPPSHVGVTVNDNVQVNFEVTLQ
jgi:polyisoprenoid-binding protein YceI